MDVFDIITLGWKVFPCVANGKEPLIKGWPELASSDRAQVDIWAEQFPNCNWGIACGPSGICAVDVDVKKGKPGDRTFIEMELTETGMPETFVSETPTKGRHHVYLGVTQSRVPLLPGVDIKSSGGYIVCPGSTIDGLRYEYRGGSPVALPDWLKKKIGEQRPRSSSPNTFTDEPADIQRAVQILQTAEPAVEGSGGNNRTYATACRIRDLGINESTCVDLLLEHWNDKCSPPWNGDELAKIVGNAYHYASGQAGSASVTEVPFLPKKINRLDYEPIPICEIGNENPPRNWIAEGWVPEGSSCFTLFAGEGGAGKSLLTLQLGLSVATGSPWLGVPTKQMPVLIVTCEDDLPELNRRVWAIKHKIPALALGADVPLFLLPRVGMNNVLCVEENGMVHPGDFVIPLNHAIGTLPAGPKLLVLDTVADFYLGNENSRSGVNAFMKTIIGGIAKKHNATPIIVSHPSKAQGSTYSGSTAWNNSVRNRIFLGWAKEEDCTSKYRTLSAEKANYSPIGVKITLEWDEGVLVPISGDAEINLVDSAVLECIVAAAESGNPFNPHNNAARPISSASICYPDGKKISKTLIHAAIERLTEKKKITLTKGSKDGKNGFYPVIHNVISSAQETGLTEQVLEDHKYVKS